MNEAQFGLRFAIKNTKQVQKTLDAINTRLRQMGVTADQTGKKLDKTGKEAEQAGQKQKETFSSGVKQANNLSKSLDKVVTKWLSIGGAVTLVSRLMRRAFARIDELTGLNRMAKSAGVLDNKLYSLGRRLKEAYGGDISSAASAYTSIGDIVGAARSGRGISQDVVEASSRYGIALNGGMLTEDQLITNIARAMQAQSRKGNMYGVRDIASAFGIDEAMMLHLAEKGANWDRNLPKANIEKAKEAALKAKQSQERLNQMVDSMVDTAIPLIEKGMNAIIKIMEWLRDLLGKDPEPVKNKGNAGGYIIGNTWYKTNSKEEALKQWRADEHRKWNMKIGSLAVGEILKTAISNIRHVRNEPLNNIDKMKPFVAGMSDWSGWQSGIGAPKAELDGTITVVLENGSKNGATVKSSDFGYNNSLNVAQVNK